eukprot:6547537-Prymnesium_polylepis.1
MRGLVVTCPIRFGTHGAGHISREAERGQSLSSPGARGLRARGATHDARDAREHRVFSPGVIYIVG